MAELDLEKLTMDPAAQELLKKAAAEGVETILDRAKTMKPCPIGAEGACCRICAQGPCRVPPPKKGKRDRGREETAHGSVRRHRRNHRGPEFRPHGLRRDRGPQRPCPGLAKLFIEVANGRTQGYKIKDVTKLKTGGQGLGRGHHRG